MSALVIHHEILTVDLIDTCLINYVASCILLNVLW